MNEQEDRDLHSEPTVVAHVPDLGPIFRASTAPPKRVATPEELRRLEKSRESPPPE